MSARSKARKRALDLLYGADVRQVPIADLVADEAKRATAEPHRESSWMYAREIATGVSDHLDKLDDAIRAHAQGWTLERMPAVDRAIARMATWEIVYNPDVPDGVAIAEAVEFATVLSTENSAGFLNGLLSAISRDHDERDSQAISGDAADPTA